MIEWGLGNGNRLDKGGDKADLAGRKRRGRSEKRAGSDLGMARLKTGGFKCSWEKSGKTSRGWGRRFDCRLVAGGLQGLLRVVKRPLNPRAGHSADADLF